MKKESRKTKLNTNDVGAEPVSDHEKRNTMQNVGAASHVTHRKRNMLFLHRGITIISLIITIIILLILAGVTINLTIGENGIFGLAQKASKNYVDASKKEKNEIAKVGNAIIGYVDGIRGEYSKSATELLYSSENTIVTTSGTVLQLSNSIENYDFIQVIATVDGEGQKAYCNFFNVKEIKFNTIEYEVAGYGTRYVTFYFLEDKKSIKIVGNNTIGIYRIYGIKL